MRNAGAIAVAFVVLSTLSGVYLWHGRQLVPYTPVLPGDLRGSQLYEQRPDLLSPHHRDAVIAILAGYREPYEVREGTLYIRRSLQRDEDLLMNYTLKAREQRRSEQ